MAAASALHARRCPAVLQQLMVDVTMLLTTTWCLYGSNGRSMNLKINATTTRLITFTLPACYTTKKVLYVIYAMHIKVMRENV